MNGEFDNYLKEVNKHLKPLPLSERMDIIKEIRSQIIELETVHNTPEEILSRFGSPKNLTKAYLSNLITEKKSLSLNTILALCAYYTLVGFTGIIILPILIICASVFSVCSIVTPILVCIKMLNSLLNLGLPLTDHVEISAGVFPLNPILEFLLSLPLGALLFTIGWGCWKLLRAYIKSLGKAKLLTAPFKERHPCKKELLPPKIR